MTMEKLDHIAEQLKSILVKTAYNRSKVLGSVTSGPYRNFFFPSYATPKYAFSGAGEFFSSYPRSPVTLEWLEKA